jgi:hypothetical protein
MSLSAVIVGHSRSKNGVASLAYVPAIPPRMARCLPKRDARHNAGHDNQEWWENAMRKPDTPFPRHWLYYIAIKLVVLAGALALALRLYGAW